MCYRRGTCALLMEMGGKMGSERKQDMLAHYLEHCSLSILSTTIVVAITYKLALILAPTSSLSLSLSLSPHHALFQLLFMLAWFSLTKKKMLPSKLLLSAAPPASWLISGKSDRTSPFFYPLSHILYSYILVGHAKF